MEKKTQPGTSSVATEADPARRKLLRSAAALGGLLAAGSLPWESPAVKSFFGQRAAWAQPTPDFACQLFANFQAGVTRCGNPMNTFCIDIGLLTATKIVAYLQNTGTQPFDVTNVLADLCPGQTQSQPSGPIVSPPTPQVLVQPQELVPLNADIRNCDLDPDGGPFEFCIYFTTNPPNLCIPLRVRGSCPAQG